MNEHLASEYHPAATVCFSDGSVTDNSAAAAVYFPATDTSIGRRLLFKGSSTLAELVAIHLAVHNAQSNPYGVVICSDSKAALHGIQNPTLKGCNPCIVNTIHLAATLLDCPVFLQWVPAHVGIIGNEKADAAARAVLYLPSSIDLYAAPPSLYPSIDGLSLQEHQDWFSSLPSHYLSNTSSTPSPLLNIRISLPRYHTVVHRIRCHTCITPSDLFHLRKLPSPDCSVCLIYGDTTHLLLHCRKFSQERLVLSQALSQLSLEPLSIHLLTSTFYVSNPDLLYRFLLSTRLLWSL